LKKEKYFFLKMMKFDEIIINIKSIAIKLELTKKYLKKLIYLNI